MHTMKPNPILLGIAGAEIVKMASEGVIEQSNNNLTQARENLGHRETFAESMPYLGAATGGLMGAGAGAPLGAGVGLLVQAVRRLLAKDQKDKDKIGLLNGALLGGAGGYLAGGLGVAPGGLGVGIQLRDREMADIASTRAKIEGLQGVVNGVDTLTSPSRWFSR